MPDCASCGQPLKEDSRFCENCGAQAGSSQQGQWLPAMVFLSFFFCGLPGGYLATCGTSMLLNVRAQPETALFGSIPIAFGVVIMLPFIVALVMLMSRRKR